MKSKLLYRTQSITSNITALAILVCILTNLSQMPALVSVGITQYLSYPVWVIIFCYVLISDLGYIYTSKTFKIIFFFFCFSVLIILGCVIFTRRSYLNSSMLSSFFISFFIFFIGSQIGHLLEEEHIEKICMYFTYSISFVALIIYFDYFRGTDALASSAYAYGSKNSISQIIATAIIISLILSNRQQNKKFTILNYVLMCSNFVIVMLLRSRATILGLLIIIVYYIVSKRTNKTIRRIIIVLSVLLCFGLLFNSNMYELVVNRILLGGRDTGNLDSVSSGRISILQSFPEQIDGHYLFGIGARYFECAPVSIVLQFGLIGGFGLLGVMIYTSYCCFKWRNNTNLNLLLFLICICYMVNSLFEGLAPFGPGAKCYFLWFLFGLIQDGRYIKKRSPIDLLSNTL